VRRRYILNGLIVLSLVLCAAAIALCLGSYRAAADRQQPTTQRNHPFWTLASAEKRKLLVRASALKAGDTYDQVVAALGKPTYDRQLVPKGSTVSHGRSLRYQAVVWEENLVNESEDEWVFIVLDTDGVVREVSVRLTVSD
jgi:hypothetical protein